MALNLNINYNSQKGATLLLFMLILVSASSYALISKLNTASNTHSRQQNTSSVLSEAKQVLIGYALTYPENNAGFGPGYLPCPDRNNDGFINPGTCASSTGTTIGRFPWRSLGVREMIDHSGTRLWYVLSDNYRNNPKINTLGGFMNSDNPGQLTLDGVDDIVALIIAPGEPVGNQNRNPLETDITNEIANYLEAENADIGSEFDADFVSSDGDDFNDRVISITRKELMQVIEKRILGEVKTVLTNYKTNYGAYPWLSPFANPAGGDPLVTGTATAGSSANQLEDTSKNFNTLGILEGDLIINTTDGSHGTVSSVDSATQLTIAPLNFGTSNTFSLGDSYTIPRFNGEETTREGLLPYHESNEPFKTDFTTEWEATVVNGSSITVDTGVTSSIHDDAMITSTETSNGTLSTTASVSSNAGSCIWSNEMTVDCKGQFTDQQFVAGTATCDGDGDLDPDDCRTSSYFSVLIDDSKNFTNLGVKIGDLVINYSDTTFANTIATSQAEIDSTDTTLIDTTQDFIAAGIEPRDYILTNETDDTKGIIQEVVSATELEILPLPGNEITMDVGDDYSIRQIRQAIVTEVSASDTLIVSSTDNNAVVFEEHDNYRIRIATESKSARAETPTNIANFIVYDSDANFSGIKVGDAVANGTHGGYGTITATGTDANGPWFTYTALKGGTYPDIFRGEAYVVYHNHVDQRQYDFELQYTGNSNVPTLLTDGSKRRNVCIGYGPDCAQTTTNEILTTSIVNPSVMLQDYDVDNVLIGKSELRLPENTTGNIRTTNIQYDLSGNAEIPSWFIANNWHHLMFIAISSGDVPESTDPCVAGASCLQITDIDSGNTNDDIQALIVSAGMETNKTLSSDCLTPINAMQDRTNGTINEYFELSNCSQSDDIFQEQMNSSNFNDQILIVEMQ